MLKCKELTCDRGNGNLCCHDCLADCGYRCEEDPATCGGSFTEETTDLTLFQSKAVVVMQEIANLDRMKKELDAKDKVLRQELQKFMDQYNIKKFENDFLKVTYVAPTTKATIDTKKLKEELPAVAEKYTKVSQVKGSVRIDVK